MNDLLTANFPDLFGGGYAMSSPNSPTLTHASSVPEDSGMDLFDFAAFEDSPLSLGQDRVMIQSQDASTASLQSLYEQYFGNPQKDALDTSAINPLLLEVSPPIEEQDEDMDEPEDDGDYSEAPDKPKRKAKAAAPVKKAQPKRKVKSTVADLALPMEASPVASVQPATKDAQGHLPHIVFPVPDYADRPPPAEYAKLSSREKRQLRNKISARNFRHRRKEYITTLEGEIQERDTTISALQEEVTTLKVENKTLRTDLDLLKKTVDELLNKARPTDHPPEPKFNPAKDAFAVSNAWTASPSINVHTTFVPSPASSVFSARNMNPLMDKVKPAALFHLPGQREDDSFLGTNPFTLDGQSMDRYRSQLYSNLTSNLANAKQPAPGFKPSFFAPLSHPDATTSADAEQQVRAAAARQTALVAREAAATLAGGLLQSFWRTFTGSNPHHLADLLAGRSELKIVPATSAVEELDRGLQALSVSTAAGQRPREREQKGIKVFGGRKT